MSQFTKLFEAIENKQEIPKERQKPKLPSKKKSDTKSQKKAIPESMLKSANKTSSAVSKQKTSGVMTKSSRKNGKSSNDDYTQVLTYIRKDTHKQMKKALIDDPEERDLSDLVEQLLSDWLLKNQG